MKWKKIFSVRIFGDFELGAIYRVRATRTKYRAGLGMEPIIKQLNFVGELVEHSGQFGMQFKVVKTGTEIPPTIDGRFVGLHPNDIEEIVKVES